MRRQRRTLQCTPRAQLDVLKPITREYLESLAKFPSLTAFRMTFGGLEADEIALLARNVPNCAS